MQLRRITAAVAAALVLAACGGVDSESDASEPPETATAQEVTAEEPTPEAESEEPTEPVEEEPTETEEPAEPESDLGEEVKEAALAAAAIDSFQALSSDSIAFYIADFETVSTGTVRVYAQADFTDDEREDLARWVANMTCDPVPDLDTIVVRDTSGIDSNHRVSQVSLMPACSS